MLQTTDNYQLVRNANIEVVQTFTSKRQPIATVIINDDYVHEFPHTSRVSKHLDMMEPNDLATRLTGGDFFIVENKLVDFRDGQYNGFVHENHTIDTMMNLLGYQYKTDLNQHHRKQNDENDSQIVLRKVWDKNEISVPGYLHGGDFHSLLSFQWNPFVKTINSAFDLVRLICTNGMVGVTSFLNNKIPVMNRWEEHLDIASRQIQNKVNDIVIQRVQQMALDRASVNDCLQLETHAVERFSNSTDKDELNRLQSILFAVSAQQHLSNVYKDGVFQDKNLAAQLPAHLSAFDVFNIATELRTHTTDTTKSSNFALDKFANNILFDRETNYNQSAAVVSSSSTASFADPERAFYGDLLVA